MAAIFDQPIRTIMNTKRLADKHQNAFQAAMVLNMRNSGTAHLSWKGFVPVLPVVLINTQIASQMP